MILPLLLFELLLAESIKIRKTILKANGGNPAIFMHIYKEIMLLMRLNVYVSVYDWCSVSILLSLWMIFNTYFYLIHHRVIIYHQVTFLYDNNMIVNQQRRHESKAVSLSNWMQAMHNTWRLGWYPYQLSSLRSNGSVQLYYRNWRIFKNTPSKAKRSWKRIPIW